MSLGPAIISPLDILSTWGSSIVLLSKLTDPLGSYTETLSTLRNMLIGQNIKEFENGAWRELEGKASVVISFKSPKCFHQINWFSFLLSQHLHHRTSRIELYLLFLCISDHPGPHLSIFPDSFAASDRHLLTRHCIFCEGCLNLFYKHSTSL